MSQGLFRFFDYFIDGEWSAQTKTGVSFSILLLFSSIEEWTYLSSVIFTLECPKISLSVFTSKPASIHLVANVWRSE